MLKRGAFLVFEGVDRCGKTTQTKLLVEKLKQNGKKVELMRFPGKRRFSSSSIVLFFHMLRKRKRTTTTQIERLRLEK